MNSPQRRQLPSCGFSRSVPRRGSCDCDWRWKRCAAVRFGAVVTTLLLWIGVTTSVVTSYGAVSDYSIDTWQVEQGLPDNSVTSIVQTPDGYLWFGTFNGLVRFDGVRFKVFDSRTPGLGSERVLRLFVDGHGALWISTEQGQLSRFAEGRFISFGREEGWPMEPCVGRGMGMDRSGTMYFLTEGRRLLQFDGKRFISPPIPLSPDTRLGMLTDAAGRICLRLGDRIGSVEDGRWTEFANLQTEEPLGVMTRSRSGGIWFFRGGRLLRVQAGGDVVETIDYPGLKEAGILEEDEAGQIWAGTWGGGLLRLARDGSFQRFNTENGLPNDVIRVLFEDREGNYWIGTNGGGLTRLKRKAFSKLEARHSLHPLEPIPLALAQDSDQNLWVGYLDIGAFRYRTELEGSALTQIDSRIDAPGVWAALTSRSGAIWLGSYGSGLGRISAGTTRWWSAEQGLLSGRVVALCEATDGTLWLGTDGGGLSRFDGTQFTNYTAKDGLLSDQIRALAFDASGTLWIGSIGGGLNAFKDGLFTGLTPAQGLPDHTVQALLPDADGSIWVGTGHGLCRLKDDRLFAFDAVPELADAAISVILDDNLGFLWCGSNRGVFRVARAELEAVVRGEKKRVECTAYGRRDGLASAQCSTGQPAGLRTPDGRLWFATVNGLSVVDPRRLQSNRMPPPVVIEEMSIDGKSATSDHSSGVISVPSGPRRVEIRYTGASLTAPERVRFKRQVEGFENGWQDVGGERVATYSGLQPGRYRFRVIAANNDGVWNAEGASLAFVVQPAVWQTWWFRSLLVLSFGGIIGFVYHRRVVRLEAQRLAQDEFSRGLIESQEQERKRIAGELHDSLGQNLLIIKNRALLGLASDGKETTHYHEISDTATQALQEVRQIAYKLRPYQLDQFGLTEAIEAIVEKVGSSGTIHFIGELPPIDGIFSPEAESHIFRVVQEATNNIVKHSGAAEARIIIQRNARDVKFVVSDDGRGFASDHPGAADGSADGVGLPGIKERVRILGGTIEIKSAHGRGTTITMIVPVPPQSKVGQSG